MAWAAFRVVAGSIARFGLINQVVGVAGRNGEDAAAGFGQGHRHRSRHAHDQ
jgi:hypothetical protein